MYLGVTLRDRLPKVAALFAEGMISARLVAAIAWRTGLIQDDTALALADKTLAEEAIRFGPLSVVKTNEAIDAIIDQYDPAALRRSRAAARGREVVIDSAGAAHGTTNLWGTLYSTDAAMLEGRLTRMAHGVCDDDPRTITQRRADALGALAAGAQRLACGCGNAACPAGLDVDQRATSVVIHVVADEAALSACPDPSMSGERPPRPFTPGMSLSEALAPDPEPDCAGDGINPRSGRIVGGGAVPAPLLAELIRSGAKLSPVHQPGDASAESGYRPSAALERFIRCRDLTCRFPNCDRPAEFCDVDHTVPFPLGPTHPSNLKCLCRKHHLLKTFWTAWHQPTRDLTGPSCGLLPVRTDLHHLSRWSTVVSQPVPAYRRIAHGPNGWLRPAGDRGIMMPKRRRTREQERAYRIDAERALNAAHVAERNNPPPF